MNEIRSGSPSIDFDKARDFLVDDALPFWSSTGTYSNGCFVEHLDLNGNPVDPGFTRVRVQARQIYVFSNAELSGLFHAPDLCARAVDFFIRSAWLGPDRGWAKLIGRDGRLIDDSSDLYDISFALFALAWRHRIARDPRCLEIAHQTLDFLDAFMKHPQGGYENDAAGSRPRQQNPHMHLMEAMNAWADASGHERFLNKSEEILNLFENKFSDPRTGALCEFFNEDWTPALGLPGEIVEPGHQFEWAWIIGHYGRLSGVPRRALMERIIAFGMRYGYDPESGLTIDQTARDGRSLNRGHRLWPQTEAIKAFLAATEFLGQNHQAHIAKTLDALFERFIYPGPRPGGWIDHYDAAGVRIVEKVPTTSLYHLSLAFFELLRLKDVLNEPNRGLL